MQAQGKGDQLTDEELLEWCGVEPNAKLREDKIRKALDDAGIHYVMKFPRPGRLSVATCWHWIHNPYSIGIKPGKSPAGGFNIKSVK